MTDHGDTHGRGTTSVPMAPGALLVLGHTVSLMRGQAAWLSACRRTAPLVEVRLGRRRAYLACAPRLVDEMHALTTRVFLRVMLPAAEVPRHAALAFQVKGLTDGMAVRAALPWFGSLPLPANPRFDRARSALWEAARQAADRTRPDPGHLLTALSVPDARGRVLDDGNSRCRSSTCSSREPRPTPC